VTTATLFLISWRFATRGALLLISVPAVLLIAWVAGRLLGVRRSWTMSLLAGITGWLAGVVFSLILANNDVQAPGFTGHVWLFSVIFTMCALAALDMLAKPGSFARAQAGFISVPRPLRALRRRSERVRRYLQLTRIAAKHGLGPYLGLGRTHQGEEVGDGRASLGHRVSHALEECGGMFVKLGQVLSTRSDLLPPGMIGELAKLQDRVAPAARPAVEALMGAELGAPVTNVFAEFDWQPIAAASIAQAYSARLKTGEPVIVKVQRPAIAEAVERDIQVLLGPVRSRRARPGPRSIASSTSPPNSPTVCARSWTSRSRRATPSRSPPTWPPCRRFISPPSTPRSPPPRFWCWNGSRV
jgi:ubiquinone biosynthesis protein